MRIAPEGWLHALPVALVGLAALAFGWRLSAALLGLFAVLLLLFFRIPERGSDAAAEAILAAADGIVTRVDTELVEELAAEPRKRVATFLSVFDVHVQFVPTAGTVRSVATTRGRGRAAFRAGVERENQNVLTLIDSQAGPTIGVRQIAGLLARRAIGWLEPGTGVDRGQLLGIIRFGSRVDLLLPPDAEVAVRPGQRVRGGKTVVARLPSAERTPRAVPAPPEAAL